MDFSDTLIVQAVLQTSVDQLAIVGGTLDASIEDLPIASLESASKLIHLNASESDLETYLTEEYTIIQSSRQSPMGVHRHVMRLLMVEADYLQEVLENTLHDVSQSRSFFSLQQSVAKSEKRAREKLEIKNKEKELKSLTADLREKIVEQSQDTERNVLESNLLIARLKDELTEARRSTRGEEEFVSKLELVRESERMAAFDEEERTMVEKRDYYKRDIEYEQRVTVEIESWLSERKSQLKELLQFWMEKSKTDSAAKELQLQDLVANREADLKLKEDSERRLQEARDYVRLELARREGIRVEKERQALEVQTSVRIQSWWRMIMVRRGLGQFKKKKPIPNQKKSLGDLRK